MWHKIIQASDWSTLVDLVSPKTFELISFGELSQELAELAGNYGDASRFGEVVQARRDLLEKNELSVRVHDSGEVLSGEPTSTRADGQKVLELYFHQILSGQSTILDLRHSRFRRSNDGLDWEPNRFYLEWAPEFVAAVRKLYIGFYTDDDEMFRSAMKTLNIEVAEDSFWEHMGDGRQRAVEFELLHFRQTAQKVLRQCKEANVDLHRNVIALGLYLATLYEHLETIGGEFDVRGAFLAVHR